MPYPYTTSLSLLLGLGTRIAFNKFVNVRETITVEDHVLSGLAQGVALYYFLMEFPYYSWGVGFVIGARIFIKFIVTHDTLECACLLLGVASGVLFTDVISQVVEDTGASDLTGTASYDGSIVSSAISRRRLVQFRSPTQSNTSRDVDRLYERRRREFLDTPAPSVTTATTQSWDSMSDWIDPNHTMNPLEREVAALRKKASLADSERRRFKEEQKWAMAQGNKARATQMGWQVKRYSALMQSFHREADLRLLESTNQRHRQEMASVVGTTPQTPAQAFPSHPVVVAVPVSTSAQPPAPLITVPQDPPTTRDKGKGRARRRSNPPEPEERPLPVPPPSMRRASGATERSQANGHGSGHTTHHHQPKSILSRPGVRVEVHE